MVFAFARTNDAICPRTADKKRESLQLLSQPFNKLDNRIYCVLQYFFFFAFKPQQSFTSIWSEEKEILEKQKKGNISSVW